MKANAKKNCKLNYKPGPENPGYADATQITA